VLAVTGLLAAACSGEPSAGSTTTTTTPPPPPAKVAISPAANGQAIATDTPIKLTADGGKITDVQVTGGDNKVDGKYGADNKTWTSSGTLNVSKTYTVSATVTNPAGKTTTASSTFTTITPNAIVHTHIFEGENATYGVGMPIVLFFSPMPTDSSAFTKAVKVTVDGQPVDGAWFRSQPTADEVQSHTIEAHFRPQSYWPADSKVHVDIPIGGL